MHCFFSLGKTKIEMNELLWPCIFQPIKDYVQVAHDLWTHFLFVIKASIKQLLVSCTNKELSTIVNIAISKKYYAQ